MKKFIFEIHNSNKTIDLWRSAEVLFYTENRIPTIILL